MKDLNSELEMENFLIMQENEKLKMLAEFISQENKALLNELNHLLAIAAAAGIPIPHDLNRSTTSSSKANNKSNKRGDTQEATEGCNTAGLCGGARKGVAENVLRC
ncbi:hypothetical protein SASPL_105560 [Salvia splendens]|uniref:Uncharacterized protein n=1 Tax=Salvia splendens TaxID=180675 RepID=A0A8X8YK66_SALSN|nr:hypothetical protein SASPL_105560 [Salvia splendens]